MVRAWSVSVIGRSVTEQRLGAFGSWRAQLLPLPRHFGQLAQLVTEDMVSAPCGPDPGPYLEAIRAYQQAGFDEVYLGQVGGRLEGAFDFPATQVLPQVRETGPSR